MYDYRKKLQKDEQESALRKLILSTTTIGVVAAQMYYLKKLQRDIQSLDELYTKLSVAAKGNVQSYIPIISSVPTPNLKHRPHKTIGIERLTDYNPWPQEKEIDFDYYKREFDDENEFIRKEAVDGLRDINQIEREKEILIDTLADDMAYSRAKTMPEVEKKYKGLHALLLEHDIEIVYARKYNDLHRNTFELTLKDKDGHIAKVSLPNYQGDLIQEGIRTWLYRPEAQLSPENILYKPRFDAEVIQIIERVLTTIANKQSELFSAGQNPQPHSEKVAEIIQNTINFVFQKKGVILTSNPIKGRASKSFIYSDIIPYTENIYKQKEKRALQKILQAFEGRPIYEKTADGQYINTQHKSSFTGISETAFTKSAAGSNLPVFGIGPYPYYGSQTVARLNIAKGKIQKETSKSIAVKLGIVSSNILKEITKNKETIPIRRSSMLMIWDNNHIIPDGSIAAVIDAAHGRVNLDDFTIRRDEGITLSTSVNNKIPKKVKGIIQTWKENYGTEKQYDIHIRKGEFLGFEPESNKPIYAPFSGIVTGVYDNSKTNTVKLIVSQNQPLQFMSKEVYSKSTIFDLITKSSIDKYIQKQEIRNRLDLQSKETQAAIDFIATSENFKRYNTGSYGIGFIHKVINDIGKLYKKQMENLNIPEGQQKKQLIHNKITTFTGEFIKYMLGEDAYNSIQKVHIDKDFNVGIEFKNNINESSPEMKRAIEIEMLIDEALKTNNWGVFVSKIHEIENFINSKIDKDSINYKLIDYAKSDINIGKPRHYIPAFIMDGYFKGDPGKLAVSSFNPLAAIHMVSEIDNSAVASTQRTINGFVNGVKLTEESMRVFTETGLAYMERYMSTLLDHNMSYILNKYISPERMLLNSITLDEKGKKIKIGNREYKINIFDPTKDDDLLTRMHREIIVNDAKLQSAQFRFISDNIRNISSADFNDEVQNMLSKDSLSINDLQQMNKLGIGGNSVIMVKSELMHELAKHVNTRKANEFTYLKLPFNVRLNSDLEGDLVPLINFDRDDTFKLLATFSEEGGNPVGTKEMQTFYTMRAMQNEQAEYLHKIAEKLDYIRTLNKGDEKHYALQQEIEKDTQEFLKNLAKFSSGKNSQFIEHMFSINMPLSAQGLLTNAKLKPLQVGVTPTMMARILTGNNEITFEQLEKDVKRTKQDIQSIHERIRSIKDTTIDSPLEVLESIGIRQEYQDESPYDKKTYEIIKSPLSKGILEKIKKNKIQNLIKKQKHLMIKNLDKQMAYDLITQTMKEDKPLKLGGLLVRNPIIGPYSEYPVEVVIHNPTGNQNVDWIKKTLKEISKQSNATPETIEKVRMILKNFSKSHEDKIYTSAELQSVFYGDQDGDIVQLVLTANDVISEEFDKILKQYNLRPTDPDIPEQSILRIAKKYDDQNMNLKALLSRTKKLLVTKTSGEDGAITYKAANAESIKVLDVITQLKEKDPAYKVKLTPLNKYIEENIIKPFPENKITKYNKTVGKFKQIISKELGIDIKDVDTLYVVNDLYRDETHDATKLSSAQQTDPFLIHHEIKGLKPGSERLFKEIVSGSKEAYIEYQRQTAKEQLPKFTETKTFTADAYKLGQSFLMLAEKYYNNDEKRKLIWTFASDFITQNTISSKHGTVSYIDFIKKILSEMESTNPGNILVDSEKFKRLVNGNPIINIHGYKDDLLKFNMIDSIESEVDFNTFYEYVNKRIEVGEELKKIHISAGKQLRNIIEQNITDTNILKTIYRNYVKSGVESIKVNNVFPFATDAPEWVYDTNEVNNYILNSRKQAENLAKQKKQLTSFTEDDWKFLINELKIHREIHGNSLLSEPSEQIRTRMANYPGAPTAYDALNLIKQNWSNEGLKLNTPTEDRFAHVIASLQGERANIIHDNVKIDSIVRASLRKKEKDVFFRRLVHNSIIENSQTVFYPRTLFDVFIEKTHKPILRSDELEHIRSKKIGSYIAGIISSLVVGSFVGHAINLMTTNDVLGITESKPGLGGNYYERTGIIGKELEMFLKEKPVRLVSNYNYTRREDKYLRYISSINDVYSKSSSQKHTPAYQGVIIR